MIQFNCNKLFSYVHLANYLELTIVAITYSAMLHCITLCNFIPKLNISLYFDVRDPAMSTNCCFADLEHARSDSLFCW